MRVQQDAEEEVLEPAPARLQKSGFLAGDHALVGQRRYLERQIGVRREQLCAQRVYFRVPPQQPDRVIAPRLYEHFPHDGQLIFDHNAARNRDGPCPRALRRGPVLQQDDARTRYLEPNLAAVDARNIHLSGFASQIETIGGLSVSCDDDAASRTAGSHSARAPAVAPLEESAERALPPQLVRRIRPRGQQLLGIAGSQQPDETASPDTARKADTLGRYKAVSSMAAVDAAYAIETTDAG